MVKHNIFFFILETEFKYLYSIILMNFILFLSDMAQNMLQMSRVWNDLKYENIQRT